MTALSDLCAVTFSAPSGLAAVSPVPASAAVPAVALQAAAHFSDGMPPRGLEALTHCPAALAEVLEAVGSAFEGAPRRTADAHPGTMRPVHSPAAGDALLSAPGLAVTEGEMPARPTPAAEAPVVAGHASAPSAPRTESPSSLPAAGAQTAPVTEMSAQPMRVPTPAAGDALLSAPGLAVTEGAMPARPTPAAEAPVVAGPESSPSAPLTSPSPLPAADAQTAPVTEMPAQPVRVPTPAAEAPVVAGPESSPSAPLTSPSSLPAADAQTAPATAAQSMSVPSPAAGDALPSASGLAVTGGAMPARPTPAAEAPVVAGHASAPSAPRTSPSSLPAADAQTAPVTEPAAQPVRVPSSAAGDALPSAPGLAVTEGEMPARPTPAAEGAPAKAVTAEHSAAPAERKRPGAVSDGDELPLPCPAERAPREVPPAAAPMAAAESVPQQAGPVQTAAVPDAAARVTAMLRAAADAVAASVQVSPDLARTGAGEIRVRLRPDVLDGSSVRFEASGGDLKITLYPATQAAAAVLEAHLERFRTHLAERVANWRINVGVAAWDPHPPMKSGTGRTERDE